MNEADEVTTESEAMTIHVDGVDREEFRQAVVRATGCDAYDGWPCEGCLVAWSDQSGLACWESVFVYSGREDVDSEGMTVDEVQGVIRRIAIALGVTKPRTSGSPDRGRTICAPPRAV